MRRLLAQIFAEHDDFVLAFAADGYQALVDLHRFEPDVITLDVNMPGMSGLETLDRIMLERPCPVVMFSSMTSAGGEVTLDALALGAVDFIAKPRGAVSLRIEEMAQDVVAVVRAAARAKVRRSHRLVERLRLRAGRSQDEAAPPRPRRKLGGHGPDGLVLIGASTGGPPALDAVLSALPESFPWPVLVAQHMPASFTGSLARRLNGLCRLKVVEAVQPMRLEAGVIYIGRGDADMVVARRGGAVSVLPTPSSDRYRWHPSVDRLVESATAHFPPERLVGVLLTGMGDDGARTMTALRSAGGRTLAESQATAVVWGMPGSLAALDGVDVVADVNRIGEVLVQTVEALA